MLNKILTLLLLQVFSLLAEPMNFNDLKIPLDDLYSFMPYGKINKLRNFEQHETSQAKLKYGYFYSTINETIMNGQALRLDHKTLNLSGISVSPKNSQQILIENSGKYYISWKVNTTKDCAHQSPTCLQLYLHDSQTELPGSLTQVNLTNDIVQISGGVILDVPRSGLTFELRNVSGHPITTTICANNDNSDKAHYTTANIFILESTITSHNASPLLNPSGNELTFSDLETILVSQEEHSKGQQKDDNLDLKVKQKTKRLTFRDIYGKETFVDFTGSDKVAYIEGDIVVSEENEAAVTNSLKIGNIKITDSYCNALGGSKFTFIHYKGKGDAKKIEQIIKDSLNDIDDSD